MVLKGFFKGLLSLVPGIILLCPDSAFSTGPRVRTRHLLSIENSVEAEQARPSRVRSRRQVQVKFTQIRERFYVKLAGTTFKGTRKKQRLNRTRGGSRVESGSLLDAAGAVKGFYTLSVVGDGSKPSAVHGLFQTTAGDVFELNGDGARQTLDEIEQANFPGCAADQMQPGQDEISASAVSNTAAATDADGNVLIDILVAYTPDVRNAVGGDSQAEALILTSMSLLNQAFVNSGVPAQANLAGIVPLVQSESGMNADSIFSNFVANGEGFWDEIHQKKEEYGADLVSLFAVNLGYCGLAHIPFSSDPEISASLSYSVINYSCAVGNLSFPHEIGHNFGAGHDEEVGGIGKFSYSHGHHFTSSTGQAMRTVMAYQPGTRINYFSGPQVLYNGVSTGTELHDNARTLNETVNIVASYRASNGSSIPITTPTPQPTPGQSGYAFSIGGEQSGALLRFNGQLFKDGAPRSGEIVQLLFRRAKSRAGRKRVFRVREVSITDFNGAVEIVTGLRRGAFRFRFTDPLSSEEVTSNILKVTF